jgi:cyclopropane-fatty-acyl-phospholipid synthase
MNSINPTAVNTAESPGWLGSFARNQLLKRLRQMPRGYLLIEEGDELYSFGDANDVNGVKAKIVIEDASAYRDIAFGGSIGGAEAYMLGKWSTPSLVDVVRLMSVNIDFLNQMDDARPVLQRDVLGGNFSARRSRSG